MMQRLRNLVSILLLWYVVINIKNLVPFLFDFVEAL